LEAAISQCSSTVDSGVIDACPPLKAVHRPETDTICPVRNTQVVETVTGLLDRLPGCITVTSGPGDATSADMSCPPSHVRPVIIPSHNSVPVTVKTVPIGQPKGLYGWTYMGCTSDNGGARLLQGLTTTNVAGMSIESCQLYCSSNNMKYAGLEFGSQ
jgi:hypothetical protein